MDQGQGTSGFDSRESRCRPTGARRRSIQNLNASHRPRFLLSGLLQCGCCGGGYTIVAKDRYGCATRRQKGMCENARTITRQQLETRVLDGLKNRLLAPDLVQEFVREFNEEIQRNRATEKARVAEHERRLAGTSERSPRCSRLLKMGCITQA
jgi:site-specific DNA recombinase